MKYVEINHSNLGYVEKDTDVILRDVNLNLKPDGIYALVGSNGAGKSTLINSIVGILPPISGEISVITDQNDDMPTFSRIGFCPQFPLIDWYTTVIDNIILGPMLSGKTLKESKKISDKYINMMHIGDLVTRPVDHLSGGQQQRVQIARELAKEPEIYLLDEPTTGLDVETSEALFKYLKRKAKDTIVLISSHDLTIIEEYADNIIFIDEGKIKFNGKMHEFLQGRKSTNKAKIRFDNGQEKEILITNLSDELSKSKQKITNIKVLNQSLRDIYLNIKGEK
ncbi:metal ABC transporter ATP-binding protein [Ligilactobacillus sp. LYQ112]|uniref:metal ABC transporter ATP-binding protein n=1 Tax=Ligilactobacillus sp. LYQ112 TaxID=3391060 RepID=UPI0039839071